LPARILNGNAIRDQIKEEVAADLRQLRDLGIRPGLAVILVGNNPASEIYTRNKVKSCESLGIHSERLILPETATTEDLLARVAELNAREEMDGILVQLPLPPPVDAKRVLLAVDPQKDVDGFHPVNLGNLVTQRPGLVPCTPAGILEILKRSAIPIEGQRAVVIGRSDIVGKPVALLLLHRNATVTICHSRTRDLPEIVRRAEIVVAALGKPRFVQGDWIREGAAVIDVGVNRVDGKIVGDVDFEQANGRAGVLTPVPGGVGLLTVAMLLRNTVQAFESQTAAAS